jgi:hypothetical protein
MSELPVVKSGEMSVESCTKEEKDYGITVTSNDDGSISIEGKSPVAGTHSSPDCGNVKSRVVGQTAIQRKLENLPIKAKKDTEIISFSHWEFTSRARYEVAAAKAAAKKEHVLIVAVDLRGQSINPSIIPYSDWKIIGVDVVVISSEASPSIGGQRFTGTHAPGENLRTLFLSALKENGIRTLVNDEPGGVVLAIVQYLTGGSILAESKAELEIHGIDVIVPDPEDTMRTDFQYRHTPGGVAHLNVNGSNTPFKLRALCKEHVSEIKLIIDGCERVYPVIRSEKSLEAAGQLGIVMELYKNTDKEFHRNLIAIHDACRTLHGTDAVPLRHAGAGAGAGAGSLGRYGSNWV